MEFQSHEPEFDYLKSVEIEEKVNKIRWCTKLNKSLFLLTTYDRTIKLWKIEDISNVAYTRCQRVYLRAHDFSINSISNNWRMSMLGILLYPTYFSMRLFLPLVAKFALRACFIAVMWLKFLPNSSQNIPSHQDTRYIALEDGRKLCLECLDSSIMDTSQCQPLYYDILEFYEGLNMKVEQKVPLLLVDRHAPNETMHGERHALCKIEQFK